MLGRASDQRVFFKCWRLPHLFFVYNGWICDVIMDNCLKKQITNAPAVKNLPQQHPTLCHVNIEASILTSSFGKFDKSQSNIPIVLVQYSRTQICMLLTCWHFVGLRKARSSMDIPTIQQTGTRLHRPSFSCHVARVPEANLESALSSESRDENLHATCLKKILVVF